MRQLLPTPIEDADVYEAYRPGPDPVLRLNMVVTLDGAVQDEQGRSGGLAGKGDTEVFLTLRAHADAIVAGAGTVRTEGYRPHRLRPDLAERRAADGRPDPAPIVVVSRSLDLDLGAPLFTQARTRTIVATCAAAPPDRVRATEQVATVLIAGDGAVDLGAMIGALRERHGLAQLLCEGGPTLNAGLLAAGVVDELCLTLAPRLIGPHRLGIATELARRPGLTLSAACEQDGELYLRYALSPG